VSISLVSSDVTLLPSDGSNGVPRPEYWPPSDVTTWNSSTEIVMVAEDSDRTRAHIASQWRPGRVGKTRGARRRPKQ
jgi:hypothetical protein